MQLQKHLTMKRLCLTHNFLDDKNNLCYSCKSCNEALKEQGKQSKKIVLGLSQMCPFSMRRRYAVSVELWMEFATVLF